MEFLGIPYAAPPVGELRWMPPQPVKPWSDPLDATKFRSNCAQVTELGAFAGPSSTNENCLYLNVFTTRLGSASNGNAVLVWIHGGGNVDGESNDYDAYEFNYQNAPYYFPQMPGFVALASHTIDIQFLFRNWHGGNLGVNLDQTTGQPRQLNAQETQLSDELVAAWTHFVSTGNPNASGNSPWPQFSADSGAPAVLSENLPRLTTFTDAEFSAEHHCDFWDPILGFGT